MRKGGKRHLTDDALPARLERLLDRTEIFDLVRLERLCRDQRDFAGMVECYVPNAPVRTSWFDGTVENFAEASRRAMASMRSRASFDGLPVRYRTLTGKAINAVVMVFCHTQQQSERT